MAALIPVTQPPNVEAAYEDMFKEITRKLYGEETGNGLHTLGTPVAHIATSGPTAPEGERSFTTLMSDRSLATTIEYDQNGSTETSTANNFKSEDHLTTAFGLAALMQNGFSTTGTILNTHTLSKPSTNITTTATTSASNTINVVANSSAVNAVSNNEQQRWTTTAEEIIAWPAGGGKLTAFNGSQKAIKSVKNRVEQNDVYHATNSTNTVVVQTSNNQSSSNRKNKNSNSNQIPTPNISQIQIQKRYSCGHCPYSTDRRDLYTRHENIHKDEKPFQCYACLKQFNRADHVKKHFLRMHRELAYDINKTRRSIVPEQKPIIFTQQQQQQQNTNNNQQTQQQQQQQQMANNFINSQRTSLQDSSLSIVQTIESVATAQIAQHPQMKQEKSADEKSPIKIKREKRFSCCYCPWSGADKWGLKRHLNTHTKPFVCMLCDYKAARSERLATHVLKVHNKKACNKCSFLAENQEEYQAHINEIHPHDQRPSRSSNNNNNNNSSNVLRTIGNTLVTANNQINTFQNPSTSFGTIQTTSTGGVAIYTTNDPSGNANNANGIQEIIVNPTSMVGWRLSATGSLIPPSHITHTGNEQSTGGGNTNQKRGAERLFQYLEADGSDPEDYTRQLKMDAISRNTASVAQDFHNAGGVEKNQKYVSNNKYIYGAENFVKCELLDTSPTLNNNYSNSILNNVLNPMKIYQKKDRKAMSIFYNKNDNHQQQQQQQQHIKSPPAYQTSINLNNNKINSSPFKGHRLNYLTQQDKENSNSLFTNMEYETYSASTQFQNYVKEIINKYYAETPLLCTEPDIKPKINNHKLYATIKQENSDDSINNNNDFDDENVTDETRNYFEYLSNKKDITITYGKNIKSEYTYGPDKAYIFRTSPAIITTNHAEPMFASSNSRKRKQSQPQKIIQPDIKTILRDKYLKRLVDPRKSCVKCANTPHRHNNMLVFPYHTAGSLALHRIWRHSQAVEKCNLCNKKFLRSYSRKIHMIIKHNRNK